MIDIGIDKLPSGPKDLVLKYLNKVHEIEVDAWVPKTTIQKHVAASHQSVAKILDDLVMAGTIEHRRHGIRHVYRLKP